jgi:hypothetical protein
VNDADFLLQNEGTIAVLFPLTTVGAAWIDEHLPADAIVWTGGVVIEHRFVGPIVLGIVDDGLEVR